MTRDWRSMLPRPSTLTATRIVCARAKGGALYSAADQKLVEGRVVERFLVRGLEKEARRKASVACLRPP